MAHKKKNSPEQKAIKSLREESEFSQEIAGDKRRAAHKPKPAPGHNAKKNKNK